MPLQKAADFKTAVMIHERPLHDVAQMKLDMLPTVKLIAEPLRLITLSTIKNCFVKSSFSVDM
jgi:hypothetical protein